MAKQYGIECRIVILGTDGITIDKIEDHLRLIGATAGALGVKGGMRIERMSREVSSDPAVNEAAERKACACLTEGMPAEAIEAYERNGQAEGDYDDGQSVLVNTRGAGGRGEVN